MMRSLNRTLLPAGYRAVTERNFGGKIVVDAGVIREPGAVYTASEEAGASAYQPPAADGALPGVRLPGLRILVLQEEGEQRLVAAIEVVSPSNKQSPGERQTFAAKLQTYMASGVSLIIADLVTHPAGNLHNQWAELIDAPAGLRMREMGGAPFYAAACRPTGSDDHAEVEVWLRPLAVGQPLPTLPLYIDIDRAVPMNLEQTYTDACADIRVGALARL